METKHTTKYFSLHMNPNNADDALVAEWLDSLPRHHKSLTVRGILFERAIVWKRNSEQPHEEPVHATTHVSV